MARKPLPPVHEPVLQGDLDIFSIHQQWEGFAARLQSGSTGLTLDLSACGDLDPSGIQLLAALDRDLRAKGGQLTLAGIHDSWRERFQLLGLSELAGGGPS
jgi:anti-sigma B factor antagonist